MINMTLLIVGGALISVISLAGSFYLIWFRIRQKWSLLMGETVDWVDREILRKLELAALVKELDVESEVNQLLDQRFPEMVGALKIAFPMVGMFLNEGVEILLKRQAKEQLAKIMPELKSRMASRVEEKVDLKALVQSKLGTFSFEEAHALLWPSCRKWVGLLLGAGALLGALLGALEYLVIRL